MNEAHDFMLVGSQLCVMPYGGARSLGAQIDDFFYSSARLLLKRELHE